MDAPTWTVGPSRPMDAPEASPRRVRATLPAAMRRERNSVDHGLVVHVQRRDGLWDAAALCAGKHVSRQQEGDRQSGWGDEVWNPGMAGGEMEEDSAGPVRRLREPDGHCCHQNRADPENHPAPPQSR